jgi:multidrug efflux pump subunit AcrA (membrane-fusion protein)
MWMKSIKSLKRLLYLVPLLVLAFLPLGPGCLGGGIDGLVIDEVRPEPVTMTVSGNGKLEAHQPFYIYPGASAPLASLNIRDGDYVEAGQVLASLDRGVLDEELMKAESNYLTQSSMGDLFTALFSDLEALFGAVNASLGMAEYYRSSLANAALDYSEDLSSIAPELPPEVQEVVDEIAKRMEEDYNNLFAQAPSLPAVSGSGYPASAAQADVARSELAYVYFQKAAQSAQTPEIIAPISGHVFYMPMGGLVPEDFISDYMSSEVGGLTSSMNFIAGGVEGMMDDMIFDILMPELDLQVGSRVKEETPAFMIVDMDRLLLRLKVEEADIALVEEGQRVEISLDALPRETLEGEVVHVANRSSLSLSDTSLYEVTVVIEASGGELKLGYTAYADIFVVDEEEAVVLPLEAVQMEPSPYVFVVEEGVAHSRKVTLGMEIEDRVEVIGGLKEGEEVVVQGAYKVEEGSKV